MLRPDAPANFTPELVADLREGQFEVARRVRREMSSESGTRTRYQVFSSAVPGVFSLGGDLPLFRRLIEAGDRDALLEYARACVDLVYDNATAYGLPLTTISLVQGDALGGGLEAALAADVVIAERQAKMGLPEILFNMFPGMGAIQLLSRRLPPARVEGFITSGRTYSAEEMYEMGLVDVLAEQGAGEEAVWSHIRSRHRQTHGRDGLRRAMRAAGQSLDRENLMRTTEIWVDTAIALSRRDLELMDYLIRAQVRRAA